MKSILKTIRHLAGRLVRRVSNAPGIRKAKVFRRLVPNKLAPQQQQLLKIMRDDNSRSPSPLKATEFWTEMNGLFDSWLELEGIGEIEAQTFNRFFSSHVPSRILYQASYLLYQKVKARDSMSLLAKIPATAPRNSGLGYVFDGNYVSWDLLISIDTLYSIAEVNASILTEPVTVLDLGSGWGRMGYVLQSANPKSVYVACDLPEGLLISSTYLPRILPARRCFPYIENKAVDVFSKELLLSEPGIRFCGTQDLLRFADGAIDFFINVASFQEMTREQVDQYFEIINRKVDGVLYLQEYWNAREMDQSDREIAGFQAYPFRHHWRQHYSRDISFSNQYFEAAFSIKSQQPTSFEHLKRDTHQTTD